MKKGVTQPLTDLEFAHFCTLPKVHKTPFKLQLVESGVNSTLQPLSAWVDHQLQKVLHLCPACLKDSWHFLHILNTHTPLPPNAVMLTVDAEAMCANMPTEHALEAIGLWMEKHSAELPQDCPVKSILKGLEIVMTENVFSYGNSYYKQKNGTAMGTSCACAHAMMCYS